MGCNEQFHSVTKEQTRRKTSRFVRLGDAAKELIDNQISPRQIVYDSVDNLWKQLLPKEIAQHCRISDVSGGLLKVAVDSPSYMHELRLCSDELLKELQQGCSRARIKKIKLILA